MNINETKHEVFDLETIERYISRASGIGSLSFHLEIDSTNSELKRSADRGAPHGSVVIAASQNAGRGRLGRSFFSPPDTGIYLSLLLRPEQNALSAELITPAAAVAVCRALEAVSPNITAGIKWVNDVYSSGKKICGILCESSISNGRIDYIIVGIGINAFPPREGFPKDIASRAGYAFERDIPGSDTLRARLAAGVLNEFMDIYNHSVHDRPDFIDEYISRDILSGKNVEVISGDAHYTASVLGIDRACNLIIRRENGVEQKLNAGEVSIKSL